MAGAITWAMLHWLWLSSTVSLKVQSSSRSRENPIAPPKLNPTSLLQTNKAHPDLSPGIVLPTSHHCRLSLPNHVDGPNYSAKMAQFFPATVIGLPSNKEGSVHLCA